jgi:hypothetical protein
MGTVRAAAKKSSYRRRTARRWGKTVTTTSTNIPPGLFTRNAATIARTLAMPRVSPKGLVSGLRMLSFFINRAARQVTGPPGRARQSQAAHAAAARRRPRQVVAR